MPRQERYSYSPQTQAQLIDYSPVDYSAGDALALQYLGERNKAYNEAESMPIAFSSTIGDMQFSNNDRPGVEKHLQKINEDINKEVSQKYNGDYALAKSAIAKKLLSSKGAFTIAQQNYQNEVRARELFNNLVAQGKGPTEFVQDRQGNLVRRNLTADDVFSGKSVFDEQGNVVGLPNYEIYSAGEHEKWIDDAYSKALNAATSPETISKDPKLPGYIRVAKARGMSDQDVQNYMFDQNGQLNPTGQSIVDTFLKDSPHAAREFAKIKDPNLIGRYVANIIKGQTAEVNDSQFMQDLELREANKDEGKGRKEKPISKGVIFEGGIASTQTPFTPETFYDKTPNARNKIISSQMNEPLKSTDNPFRLYRDGLIDIQGLQAYSIENSLRSKDKDLRNYYRVGSNDNDKLAKEMGFKSASDLEKARTKYKQAESKRTGLSEGLLAISKASPAYVSPGSNVFDRYDKAVKNRNLAAAKYSSRLRDLSTNYIKENKLDSDYDVNFYQPNFADDKVASASNAFNENIRAGYTKPGQFKFLDDNGGMKNKTSDELNRSYTDKTEKFEVSGVGGNSETGLIWKVKNPDGTISNATWNTGYEKKRSALVNIYGVPGLVDVLNSEAVKFDEAGNIKPGMPDVPVEFTRNVNTFKLKEEPYANDPRFHYIKQGDNYLVVNSDQDGNYRLTSTKNKNEATALPKHRIFEIIISLQQ